MAVCSTVLYFMKCYAYSPYLKLKHSIFMGRCILTMFWCIVPHLNYQETRVPLFSIQCGVVALGHAMESHHQWVCHEPSKSKLPGPNLWHECCIFMLLSIHFIDQISWSIRWPHTRTVMEAVRKLLEETVGHSLATSFNLSGRGSSGKKGFQQLRLYKVLFGK